jgi:hypothetical protein
MLLPQRGQKDSCHESPVRQSGTQLLDEDIDALLSRRLLNKSNNWLKV